MNVEDYILMHGDAEPDYLSAINRKTHQKILNPRMLSGSFTRTGVGHVQQNDPGRMLSLK